MKNSKRAVESLSLEIFKKRCSDTELPEIVCVEISVCYFEKARCIKSQAWKIDIIKDDSFLSNPSFIFC